MFSEEIKREAMLACGRYCSICHKFCGNNMEVHHIKAKADGGQDTFDNGKQLLYFIEGACGITYDEESETLDEVKLVGEFIQYVKELLDFDDLIDEPCDSVMAGFNLTQSIKELDAADFWVFAGRENQKLVGGIQKEMIFPVLIMRIVRKDSQEIIKQNLELLKEMLEGTDIE